MSHEAPQRVERPRGLLIAVEGIDGAGKTTQAHLLKNWFVENGHSCLCLHEPTKGPKGMEIRRLARAGRLDPQAEFHLFLEDRQEDVDQNIRPALQSGKVVIMDRYYISSIAYQGARGIDPRIIQIANERIAPRPDLIFLFDMDVDAGLKRIHVRDEEGPNLFEHAEYLRDVQKIFRSLKWQEIRRIDGARSIDDIQSELRREAQAKLDALRAG